MRRQRTMGKKMDALLINTVNKISEDLELTRIVGQQVNFKEIADFDSGSYDFDDVAKATIRLKNCIADLKSHYENGRAILLSLIVDKAESAGHRGFPLSSPPNTSSPKGSPSRSRRSKK